MATFVQSTVWHEFHDDDDFDVPRLAVTAWGLHGSGAYDYNGNITGAAYVTEHLITLQGTPVDFAIFYKFDGGNCGEVGARAVMRQSRVYPVASSTRAVLCARVCRGPPVPRELAAGSSPVVRSAVAEAEAPAPLTRSRRRRCRWATRASSWPRRASSSRTPSRSCCTRGCSRWAATGGSPPTATTAGAARRSPRSLAHDRYSRNG